MSFWTNLETEITTVFKSVEAEFVKVASAIKPLVVATAEEVGQAAVQAVLTETASVASGSVKLSAATSAVVSNLATLGKSVLASTAETAVQTAFNIIAANLPKAP